MKARAGALYPVHDVGRCGGAIVPLAADAGRQKVFCATCGERFDGGKRLYRGALRAHEAAGLEPERLTGYLARVLDERRSRRRSAPRAREAS